MTVIIFLIVLAVLIFVHEFGHFLFARMCGIRVDAFKIGFGPKIFQWKSKKSGGFWGDTVYGINWIPFGGYVKIHGEDPDDESLNGPDASRSFARKPRWQQAIVLLAGVFFNILFAWILYVGLFAHGVTATTDGFEKYSADFSNARIMVTDVLPGSPAAKGGLVSGDVIESVIVYSDGKDGFPANYPYPTKDSPDLGISNLQENIDLSGRGFSEAGAKQQAAILQSPPYAPIAIEYQRGNATKIVPIIPIQGLVPDKYAIGIAMNEVVDMRLPFFTAIYEGAHYTGIMLEQTAVGLYSFVANIFHGTANFSDIAGPVGIAGIVGSAAKMGFTYLLMITALISINLAIVNLIPFPALDGGRVLFVIIEGMIRRRISPKFTNTVNTVGFVLLMALMVIVTYKDIVRLVK